MRMTLDRGLAGLVLAVAACTGPAGPAGAEGPQGPAGSGDAITPGPMDSIATSDGTNIVWKTMLNLMGINVMGQLGVNTQSPAFDLHVIETTNTGVTVERYGGTAGLAFRNAAGTQQAPLPSSASIGQLRFMGYGTSGFSASKVGMEINAAETDGWTDTAQGTHLQFYTTKTGTTANNVRLRIAASGHIAEFSDIPAVSACGTGAALNASAADSNGTATTGTAATGCTITFANAYFTAPTCMLSARNGAALTYSVSTTGITITGAVPSTSIDYICRGF